MIITPIYDKHLFGHLLNRGDESKEAEAHEWCATENDIDTWCLHLKNLF
jgi:hypothetical protein